MAVDINNIEIGEGDLTVWVGVGPDGDITGATEVQVGATRGATFSAKKTYKDVEVGQVLAPVQTFVVGEEASLRVTLLENSLNNLVLAMGGDVDDISGDTYTFGNDRKVVYCKVQYKVRQAQTFGLGSAKYDTITLFRAVVSEGLELPFAKGEERTFEVTFKAYPRTTDWKLLSLQREA